MAISVAGEFAVAVRGRRFFARRPLGHRYFDGQYAVSRGHRLLDLRSFNS